MTKAEARVIQAALKLHTNYRSMKGWAMAAKEHTRAVAALLAERKKRRRK